MEEENNDDRWKKLGFKPQKENVYNTSLPYSEALDDESSKLFADVKTNLIKSILAREMRPGCLLWNSILKKYMKTYGMKFSKEDHIGLIKLYYELITIPDLEPTRIMKCASTLTQLLKKKYLLTRDELQLEWRPLYNLCMKIIEKSNVEVGMYRYYPTFETTLFGIVKACKVYYPASSTQEILDEFRPKLCPFDSNDLSHAIQYLDLFLPLHVKPEESSISYELWFDEFMTLWDVGHSVNAWENHMMCLIANLGRCQMGYINWEPYIPTMFVRFMASLQLPVYYKQKPFGQTHKLDMTSICVWIVYSLNGDKNSTFLHFEKFMQTLESYYHSANVGRWTSKLRDLLLKLSYYFVERVYQERFKKKSWESIVPEHVKLTDDDIDRFVNILKPCVEQALFTRMGSQEISLTLQYLASLRPNLIVPITLDKLYASMDSLTEPHRLTSSMMAVIAVGRYMVQGDRYPEGPTHVIPLLIALLPGIDPNDIRKSYVTFNFILQFVNMVPLIDSSDAHKYHELTEEEHIVCEASAGLEDFVLQLLDRLCVWVESSSLDFIRLEQMTNSGGSSKSRVETLSERALASVVSVVLNQCSPAIFTSALKKIYNFVISRVMEVHIAGKMLAIALNAFARVNPQETFKLFIPYLCDTIERLFNENPNIEKEEHLDAELLYNLLILSEIVTGRSEILKYVDRITKILDKSLHLTCREAGHFAARLMENFIGTLTGVTPTETKSCAEDYSLPVKDFLSIRKWGKPVKKEDLNMSWYVPGNEEIYCVQTLVNKYLVPELDKINQFCNDQHIFERQELQQSLFIIVAVLAGQSVFPMWEEKPLNLIDSVLDPWSFKLKVGIESEVKMPDGSNVRKTIFDTINRLQEKILLVDEGDTKSIKLIILIYNNLIFNKSRMQDFEMHLKSFQVVKQLIEDRLHKNKLHLRHVLIERVVLQQEFRTESRNCLFTATHKRILLNLFELGVCRYSDVRMAAQSKLFTIVSYFPFSYTILTPKMLEILRLDSQQHHERFKGCLYTLLGPKNTPIVARHDWEYIRDLWPTIVTSMPSEKPSIINLIAAINQAVRKYFPTLGITLTIPQVCLTLAQQLATIAPQVDLSGWTEETGKGEEKLRLTSECRRSAYEKTLEALMDACESGKLHWRYHSMALHFIKDLVHFSVKYNSRIVRFFLKSLLDESITVRKIALRVIMFITVQNKPKFKKVTVDPFKFSTVSASGKLYPGVRADNEWLLYNSKTLPKSALEWDEPRFVHNQNVGHYGWPKKFEVYAGAKEQITPSKRLDALTDTEKEIYEFFIDEGNVEKLIKYLSMEEKKGADRFNAFRFLIFKNLFKTFEDAFLPHLLKHLEKMVQVKEESSQRCAAEIMGALISGSKHWSFERMMNLKDSLLPLFETAISNIHTDTLDDWSICITMGLESRDPNRYSWLLEFLMNDPLKEQTSFVASNRLHLLYLAMNQQSWRNAELVQRMLDYFQAYLSHPFQNIREKISCFLGLIFRNDVIYPNGSSNRAPDTEQFCNFVLPKLNILYNDMTMKLKSDEKNEMEEACDNLKSVTIGSDEEKESILRLYKTIIKFMTLSTARANHSVRPAFIKLLPLACILQSEEVDEEIASASTNYIAVLCQTAIQSVFIPNCIESIQEVACSPFWSARAAIAEFVSAFVFHNMAIINSNPEWVLQLQSIVMQLLEDTQPEVRTAAAKVLSGLLHCKFIPNRTELLAQLKLKAKTKLKVKGSNRSSSSSLPVDIIRKRHAGVLGLCAFINSHPYDVPDYLPDIFQQLGPHLTDPQPMPATIRKTLGDFKRTHHDNWEVHKLRFTDEELSVLSDLTVPPSYYA